ncbi:MAG: TerB family tellurite resistance protein [Flavobacteriales bacterium]|nr:TerB family tellurite resistance protein [Flavobacteriales bacterium]
MAKFAKWIGGGLGWALTGGTPIGAIIGFAIGSAIDKARGAVGEGGRETGGRYQTRSGDFGVSLLILAASVMKADGKVLKSELTYVKAFFTRQFGAEKTTEFMRILKGILEQDVNLKEVCNQIRFNMQHPMRLQMLHFLFGIAKADQNVDEAEVRVIEQIANYLGISRNDFESIKAMFYKSADSAYKILEIKENATDAEVKKAYRKMAVKYHPDKVSGVGEEIQNAAKEKFLKVQEAYETVKKKRGMS